MGADDSVVSFDPRPWLRAGRFVLRAVRRRWLVVVALFLLFAGVGASAAVYLPRTYSSDTRVLAKKNYNMTALAAPRRTVPPSSEAPAQSAVELIMQQASLERIVRDARLAERWEMNAPAAMKAKQALRERIVGPLSEEETEDALVGLLRQRLRVRVEENEIVAIRVTWWNPDDVLVILDEAAREFLAARERLDVQSIVETEAILARSAEVLRQSVERRLEDFRVARSAAVGGATARLVSTRNTPAEIQRLREDLFTRQRYRQELERQRDLRIGDLQMQIAEQSASLGDRHPDQIAARQALSRLLDDDGGVTQARAQEDALEHALAELGADPSDVSGTVAGSDLIGVGGTPDDDASVIYARALLRIDVDDYQDMVTRLNNARIELETARAAFPFRYTVTRPAERPRKPDSPNAALVIVGAVLAGLGAGVTAALALELRSHAAALLREQLAS